MQSGMELERSDAFEHSAPVLRSSEASLSCHIMLAFNRQVCRDNSGEALKVHHPLSADWLVIPVIETEHL